MVTVNWVGTLSQDGAQTGGTTAFALVMIDRASETFPGQACCESVHAMGHTFWALSHGWMDAPCRLYTCSQTPSSSKRCSWATMSWMCQRRAPPTLGVRTHMKGLLGMGLNIASNFCRPCGWTLHCMFCVPLWGSVLQAPLSTSPSASLIYCKREGNNLPSHGQPHFANLAVRLVCATQ